MQAAINRTTRPLLDELAAANGFDARDLEANRAGRISARQARKFLLIPILVLPIATGLVGFLLFATMFFVVRTQGAILASLAGMAFVALLLLFLYVIPRYRDAFSGRVNVAEGRVQKAAIDWDDGMRHYYVIGEQRFEVSERAYNLMPSGTLCRIYYGRRTEKLLSIEPVAVQTPSNRFAL